MGYKMVDFFLICRFDVKKLKGWRIDDPRSLVQKQVFLLMKTMAIQSLSLAGTQTVGPDCSRITSLTLA